METAAVQGQTSGWGGRGSPPSQLEGGHDMTGEERRGWEAMQQAR